MGDDSSRRGFPEAVGAVRVILNRGSLELALGEAAVSSFGHGWHSLTRSASNSVFTSLVNIPAIQALVVMVAV